MPHAGRRAVLPMPRPLAMPLQRQWRQGVVWRGTPGWRLLVLLALMAATTAAEGVCRAQQLMVTQLLVQHKHT